MAGIDSIEEELLVVGVTVDDADGCVVCKVDVVEVEGSAGVEEVEDVEEVDNDTELEAGIVTETSTVTAESMLTIE